MPREDARTSLTRQWLTKADHDLRAAVLAAREPNELWDIAAFHSHQAAEKALKAFLAWRDVPFRRTHNLVELLEECEVVDTAFASLINGRFREAIDGFNRVLKLQPNHVQSHGNLGLAYAALADREFALRHLNRAIELDPVTSRQ